VAKKIQNVIHQNLGVGKKMTSEKEKIQQEILAKLDSYLEKISPDTLLKELEEYGFCGQTVENFMFKNNMSNTQVDKST